MSIFHLNHIQFRISSQFSLYIHKVLTATPCIVLEKYIEYMDLQKDDQASKDMLHAQAHIWNHSFSFINSMSLKCAVQLRIPDIIHRHGAPMSLSQLVQALPIHNDRSPFIYRLMRLLVHSGFFLKQSFSEKSDAGIHETEGYVLAPASRFLLTDGPLSIRPFVLLASDPMLMGAWQHLSEWLQNDDVNPLHTAQGRSLWDVAGQEPTFNRLFNEAMASDSRLVMSVLLKDCGDIFQGLNTIVDVGGGTGTVAEAIAKAFPELSCICFDLPHVVNGLVGSNKNLSYVCGDMFEAIPKADAVLLKWILHDWNDDECVRILKRCKEAIPNKEDGGKVMIIDMVVKTKDDEGDDESLIKTQLFFDMQLMVTLTGRERTEKDWAKLLLDDVGFSSYKITPILGLRSLLEVYP